jgi:proline racemase
MRFQRMIQVVGVHTGGELNEVITGGVLDVPGVTMFDKMNYLRTQGDDLRQFLLNEPRGRVSQCVNLVLPSSNPEADVGFVIMESEYYVPMSGSNTICTVTALLETGMIRMVEPVTRFTLESPAGLVPVVAACAGGKCGSVTFHNVPAFVFALDQTIDVPGLGRVVVDVAYGGMIYALVDATALGYKIVPDEGRDLVELGERIKRAAAVQCPAVHPENPEIHTINQTLFYGPMRQTPGGKRSRNTVVVSPGRLDRSPCGTGTSARLAVLHARGQMAVGESFVHESIIGSEFIGKIEAAVDVGGQGGIRPSITGSAWITAFHQYVLDPSDPFPTGFLLPDAWPTPPRSAGVLPAQA